MFSGTDCRGRGPQVAHAHWSRPGQRVPGSAPARESLMKNGTKIFAAALAVSIAVLSGAQAATVYIPEGSAGEVLVVDTATDTARGRIGGLPDVHGLGGASGVRYLVAGSYAETAADAAPAVPQPPGGSGGSEERRVGEEWV